MGSSCSQVLTRDERHQHDEGIPQRDSCCVEVGRRSMTLAIVQPQRNNVLVPPHNAASVAATPPHHPVDWSSSSCDSDSDEIALSDVPLHDAFEGASNNPRGVSVPSACSDPPCRAERSSLGTVDTTLHDDASGQYEAPVASPTTTTTTDTNQRVPNRIMNSQSGTINSHNTASVQAGRHVAALASNPADTSSLRRKNPIKLSGSSFVSVLSPVETPLHDDVHMPVVSSKHTNAPALLRSTAIVTLSRGPEASGLAVADVTFGPLLRLQTVSTADSEVLQMSLPQFPAHDATIPLLEL